MGKRKAEVVPEDKVPTVDGSCKKKKKKKERAVDSTDLQESEPVVAKAPATENGDKVKENKKKKKKAKKEVTHAETPPAVEKGKTKEKKQLSVAETVSPAKPESEPVEAAKNKKEKKKDKKQKKQEKEVEEEQLDSKKRKATDDDDEAGESSKVKKKRKKKVESEENQCGADADGADVATDNSPGEQLNGDKNNSNSKASSGQGTGAKAFQRVKADEWLDKKGAWDNSYEATFGDSGWGAKAQQILGKVRGKDFRHEKTKKKRGTYFGGKIDPGHSFSIKFESDSE